MAPAGYRDRSLNREELLRVVEDAGQPGSLRVAAAIAAAPTASPEEKRRIRVAAEASAFPVVRAALEATSAGGVNDDLLAAVQRLGSSAAFVSPAASGDASEG